MWQQYRWAPWFLRWYFWNTIIPTTGWSWRHNSSCLVDSWRKGARMNKARIICVYSPFVSALSHCIVPSWQRNHVCGCEEYSPTKKNPCLNKSIHHDFGIAHRCGSMQSFSRFVSYHWQMSRSASEVTLVWQTRCWVKAFAYFLSCKRKLSSRYTLWSLHRQHSEMASAPEDGAGGKAAGGFGGLGGFWNKAQAIAAQVAENAR